MPSQEGKSCLLLNPRDVSSKLKDESRDFVLKCLVPLTSEIIGPVWKPATATAEYVTIAAQRKLTASFIAAVLISISSRFISNRSLTKLWMLFYVPYWCLTCRSSIENFNVVK